MKNFINSFQKYLLSPTDLILIHGGEGGASTASCSALCHGGDSISCTGVTCAAQDYDHCSWTDSNGDGHNKRCPVA